jgi:hypothetical protein
MRETVEFRIPEEYALQYLPDDAGLVLGESVRKLEVSPSDPLFGRIGELDCQFKSEGKAFFTAAISHRRYTVTELASAEILHLLVRSHLDTSGEEYDTEYDGGEACIYCGAGRKQRSVLRLNLRGISRTADVVSTLAGEKIVSSRLAALIRRFVITGVQLAPVEDVVHQRASAQWQQIVPSGRAVEISDKTRAGNDPFDDDPEGTYRCPLGHVLGLNLLSDVWIVRNSWAGDDLAISRQMFGEMRGLLRPEPVWLISSRFWRALKEASVKGFRVEVAHLV